MKNPLFIFSILWCGMMLAQTNEVLTNQSVLDLYKLGLGETVIISKIKTSKNTFDVSLVGLTDLKNKGLPGSIMNAMVENAGTNQAAKVENPNDPLTDHATGIYYYNQIKLELVEITPTNATAGKTNTTAMVFSYGLAKAKTKTMVPGTASRTVMKDTYPLFYFYIPESEQTLNSYSGGASSPNDFMLLQFTIDEKKNSREVETGSFNAYSSQHGVDNSKAIAFTYSKKKKGIYEVKLDHPLSHGEYGFMFTSGTVRKVFDFSVQ